MSTNLAQQLKDAIQFTEVRDSQFEAIMPGRILSALIESVHTLEHIASDRRAGPDKWRTNEDRSNAKSAIMKIQLAINEYNKRSDPNAV